MRYCTVRPMVCERPECHTCYHTRASYCAGYPKVLLERLPFFPKALHPPFIFLGKDGDCYVFSQFGNHESLGQCGASLVTDS